MYGVFTQGADGMHWWSAVDTLEAAREDMADAIDNGKKDAAFAIQLAAFEQAEDEMPQNVQMREVVILRSVRLDTNRSVEVIYRASDNTYFVQLWKGIDSEPVYYGEHKKDACEEAWKILNRE